MKRFVGLLLCSFIGSTVAAVFDDEMAPMSARLKNNFLKYCPAVGSEILPTDVIIANNFTQPLIVDAQFVLYRFISIDDLEQSLSLFADFQFEWSFPCDPIDCELILDNMSCSSKLNSDMHFYLRTLSTWYPLVIHMNAFIKARPIEEQSSGYVWVYPFSSPQAYWGALGRFDTACNTFSFRKFPFDTLNCTMIWDSQEDSNHVIINATIFKIDESARSYFILEADIWELVDPLRYQSGIVEQYDGSSYSRLQFTVSFKRKPDFFVCNVFLPTIGLFILQLSSLAMPPELPDRPTFSMTVVLAYAVVLSMVYSSIPKTSEPVYIIFMVVTKFGSGIITTVYTLIACAVATHYQGLSHHNNKSPRPQPKLGKLTAVRLADLMVTIGSISVVLASDIVYFTLMNI